MWKRVHVQLSPHDPRDSNDTRVAWINLDNVARLVRILDDDGPYTMVHHVSGETIAIVEAPEEFLPSETPSYRIDPVEIEVNQNPYPDNEEEGA